MKQHGCCIFYFVTTGRPPRQSIRFSSFLAVFLICFLPLTSAIVHLTDRSFSFPFIDAPARFAVGVNSSGTCGALYIADPLDACSSLSNTNSASSFTHGERGEDALVRFVLIERGNCAFEDKVRNAQHSGFHAAIVYDNRPKKSLVSMIGNHRGIWVHAVFVSKAAGEILKKHAQGEQGECCITPSFEDAAWTVLVISFISLLVIVSVLATFFFTRNRRRHQNGIYHHCPGIDRKIMKIFPCFTFNTTSRRGLCIGDTCAICLEDYNDGENLRVLPCHHEFHASCVDSWLTKWSTFCPVCKHDMIPRTSNYLMDSTTAAGSVGPSMFSIHRFC